MLQSACRPLRLSRAELASIQSNDSHNLGKHAIVPAAISPIDGSDCAAVTADGVLRTADGCTDLGVESRPAWAEASDSFGHSPLVVLSELDAPAAPAATELATRLRAALEQLQVPTHDTPPGARSCCALLNEDHHHGAHPIVPGARRRRRRRRPASTTSTGCPRCFSSRVAAPAPSPAPTVAPAVLCFVVRS